MQTRDLCRIGLLLCLTSSAATAQDQRAAPSETTGAAPDWQRVLRERGWDEGDIAQFARDKLLITRETYKQIFTPYVATDLPVFVTADGPLNAFHVLLQDSLVGVERAQALQLGRLLEPLWRTLGQGLDGVAEGHPLRPAALRRAQLVLAVAMRLLGEAPADLDAPLASVVAREVERVEAAEAVLLPDWLAPPDDALVSLDYSRFRPRGFYATEPVLARFSRACSWLEAIPFRIDRDEELLAMLLLGAALERWDAGLMDRRLEALARGDRKIELTWADWLDTRQHLFGSGDDWDVLRARALMYHPGARLALVRERLLEEARDPSRPHRVEDQIRLPAGDGKTPSGLSLRVIASAVLPDAVLFQRTMEIRKDLPSGLEVATAMGSGAAEAWLAQEGNAVLEAALAARPLTSGCAGLYGGHQYVLEALLDAPEPEAPDLFRSTAWQRRAVGAVLAGWAQMRHALVLSAGENAVYGGAASTMAGFVEPDPEFFSRLADLSAQMGHTLSISRRLELDDRWLSAELLSLVRTAETGRQEGQPEFSAFADLWPILRRFGRGRGPGPEGVTSDTLADARQLAADLETGRVEDQVAVAELAGGWRQHLVESWGQLTLLCRELEALAHKQLRGRPFNAREERFLRHYGAELAGVMHYGGNSYSTPHDDAPRIVSVATVWWDGPVLRNLHAAVGRPRALYLLYPHDGQDVLTRGAVMPYFELATPQRLTDEEWKRRLDGDPLPNPPWWLVPIVGRQGSGRPIGH